MMMVSKVPNSSAPISTAPIAVAAQPSACRYSVNAATIAPWPMLRAARIPISRRTLRGKRGLAVTFTSSMRTARRARCPALRTSHDGTGESRGDAIGVRGEHRRLDQFQFQQTRRAVVVADQIHACVQQGLQERNRCDRTLRD